MNGFVIYDHLAPLCDHVVCPIPAATNLVWNYTLSWPTSVPGTYATDIRFLDVNHNTLLCVHYTVVIPLMRWW